MIKKKPIQHESREQRAFFAILKLKYPVIKECTFAIPNGGSRNPIEAKFLQLGGVKPGVPDIFCAYPCNGYHGLFIEMKKPATPSSPKGSLSPAQRHMQVQLTERQYRVCVCYSADEALKETLAYWTTQRPSGEFRHWETSAITIDGVIPWE